MTNVSWKHRLYVDIADYEEWRRPRHALVRRVEMRRADTGTPVVVLVPTLLGRLVMLWRTIRDAGR